MNVFTDRLRTHLWGIAVLIILCCVPTFLLIGILSSRVLGGVKNINRMLPGEGKKPMIWEKLRLESDSW